jgi:hypothetical protein
VDCTVTAYPGNLASDIQSRVVAALTDFLSPQNWGVPPFGDTSGRSWINDTDVRYLELTEAVNAVEGVHYVQNLSFAVSGQAKGTADITMPGVAPLPQPGGIACAATVES